MKTVRKRPRKRSIYKLKKDRTKGDYPKVLREVRILFSFGSANKGVYHRKGVGPDLDSAVMDLFNRNGRGGITKEEMTFVYKELIKTKARQFKI